MHSIWSLSAITLLLSLTLRATLVQDKASQVLCMSAFFLYQIIDAIILYRFKEVSPTPRATILHHLVVATAAAISIFVPSVRSLAVEYSWIELNAWFYYLRKLLYPWNAKLLQIFYYVSVLVFRQLLCPYMTYKVALRLSEGLYLQILFLASLYVNCLHFWWLFLLVKNRLSQKNKNWAKWYCYIECWSLTVCYQLVNGMPVIVRCIYKCIFYMHWTILYNFWFVVSSNTLQIQCWYDYIITSL